MSKKKPFKFPVKGAPLHVPPTRLQTQRFIHSFISVGVPKKGENIQSPSTDPHADRRPTYSGVRPGSTGGKRLLASSCLSVCQSSVRSSVLMEQLGSHWMDVHEIWYFGIFRESVEKFQSSLKSDKNNGHYTRTWTRVDTCDNISLNSPDNEKHVRRINNWQTPTHALHIQLYISLECWFQC